MATYVEYTLDDGSTLLVEVAKSEQGIMKSGNQDSSGNVITKAENKFKDSLKSVKTSVMTMWQELADLPIDEGEVTFGIKVTGESGMFGVCKISGEMNYQVKLKWKKPETKKTDETK